MFSVKNYILVIIGAALFALQLLTADIQLNDISVNKLHVYIQKGKCTGTDRLRLV
jgi:hypothetical protein